MPSYRDAAGRHLIASKIDYYATEAPDKICASIAVGKDLSEGFLDVTYGQSANAIDHASWWLKMELGEWKGSFETFAYFGPKDLRDWILSQAPLRYPYTKTVDRSISS